MIKRAFRPYKSLLLAIGFLAFIILMMTNFADNRQYKNEYLLKNIDDQLFHESHGPDLNEKFWKLKDSLRRIREWRVSRLNGFGESISNFFAGVQSINECDSCDSFDKAKYKSQFKNKYFIRLDGYTLKEDVLFFIGKDKYYVTYPVWDKIEETGSRTGHSETKEVYVRYSTQNSATMKGGSLLIPITEKTYKVLTIAVWIVSILIILFFIITLFVLPARTLYSIADGRPFTKENTRRLTTTGCVLLAIPIAPPLISVMVEWLLGKKIPSEIYYPFLRAIMDNRLFLIAGFIVLLIAYAFRKGYKLQQEQELTV